MQVRRTACYAPVLVQANCESGCASVLTDRNRPPNLKLPRACSPFCPSHALPSEAGPSRTYVPLPMPPLGLLPRRHQNPALCASNQDRFLSLHTLLYENANQQTHPQSRKYSVAPAFWQRTCYAQQVALPCPPAAPAGCTILQYYNYSQAGGSAVYLSMTADR